MPLGALAVVDAPADVQAPRTRTSSDTCGRAPKPRTRPLTRKAAGIFTVVGVTAAVTLGLTFGEFALLWLRPNPQTQAIISATTALADRPPLFTSCPRP